MKKIAYIVWDYTVVGGISRVAATLANEMCDFYDVHIISLVSANNGRNYKLDDRIHLYYLFEGDCRGRDLILKESHRLSSYLRKNKIDVAFLMGFQASLPALVMAKLFTRTKFVYCEHEALMPRWHEKKITAVRYLSAVLSKKTVTLTKSTRDAYIDHFHLPEKKVTNIYNCISRDVLEKKGTFNPNSKIIMSIGRFSEEKGFDILVDVAEPILKRNPDWTWDIYGIGETYDEINELVKLKGLEGRVNLKGSVTNIAELYKEAGIFVLTSRREGFSLVILEAKVNSIPCVSFDIAAGPSEMIRDGVDGYLIKNMDIPSMQKAIEDLMKDDEKRLEFSNKSIENLEPFYIETIINQWRELIDYEIKP